MRAGADLRPRYARRSVPGKDTNTGAKRARQLREELGLDARAPVDCLLRLVEEDLGVPVCVARMPGGVEGACLRLGPTPTLLVHLHDFTPRSRFTLAHELGHVRCGHDGAFVVDTYEMIDGAVRTSAEVQANAFAAELLAPADGVRRIVGDATPTLEHVVAIAAAFGISTLAAVIRCVTLGLGVDAPRVRAEIDERLHVPIWEALDPPPWDDGLAALEPDALPRLSPLLGDSALASLLRGDAAVEDVALQIGCEPAVLARGLARLGL